VRVLQPLRPELEKVMKAQPDVRYLFKEWPIFGSRWEASLQAAQIGLTVWKEKGPQAYVTYHNAVYATGHYEGALTTEDIREAAVKAGVSEPAKMTTRRCLRKTATWQSRWDSPERPGSSSCRQRCHARHHHGISAGRYRRAASGCHPESHSDTLSVIPEGNLPPEVVFQVPRVPATLSSHTFALPRSGLPA
jgi:hypothetical protein